MGIERNRKAASALFILGAAGLLFSVSLFFTNYSFITKRPVSLLSPFFLASIFFLCLAALLSRGSFKETLFARPARQLNARFIIPGMILALAVIIFLLSLTRYNSYSSNFDLAIYDQIIWNTAHGRPFISSIMGDYNSLGNHFEPVLLLLAPLYWIFPSVAVLFAVQALALASAIIPLYCVSKRILKDRLLVFSVLAAYFLSRGIQGAGMFEFHTDCFLPLLVFYAYYFLISGKLRGAAWMCFGMLLCKENAAFLVAGLGIFALTKKEYRYFGLFLIAGAAAFWIAVTKLLVPFFLGEGGTENYQYLAWLPFGPSLQDNWKVFLQNPLGFLALFFDKQRMMYYFQLLGPTGFLALFSPAHYALFLLPAGMFVLGSFGHLGLLNIMAQYSAHTVPAIFIAAISGLAFLRKKLFVKFPGNKERVVLILSLYIVFCAAGFYGKTSGHRISKFIKAGRENGAPEISSALDKYIPKDASVTSTINLSAHLSHRQKLYLLEEMQADTNYPQWENVRVSGAPLPENPLISRKRYESDYIVAHKNLSGKDFTDVIERIRKHRYLEIYRDNSGGLVIFKKSKNHTIDPSLRSG